MIIELYSPLSVQFELAHSLGLNTNLLETNLINLAIVIGVLIYLSKGVLIETLRNRRDTIITQIEDAQKRKQDVAAHLIQVQEELVSARQKALEIENDANLTIQLKTIEFERMKRDRQKRLQEMNVTIVTFENNKVLSALRQRLFRIALLKVRQYLDQRITKDLHAQINDSQLAILKAMRK